jgi:glycosyltransferase involved in cell wall biosynthesis
MKRNLLSSLGKRAYNRADAITAVSLFLKNNISKYFESPEKIVVIPNVINTSVFSFKEKNNIEHAISFLAVAHWFPPKMPMLFVKALNEVQKKISKKITLNLIGDGPLLEQIKALKLNYNINYLGSLSKEKIASYLHQTNFFLHASDVETFSMVIAEALSTGTPVIASDVGNIPNLVNINNGVLCKNTLPEWISGIEKCISTNYETQIISNEIQQKYNSEKIGTDFIRLYNKVIQQ